MVGEGFWSREAAATMFPRSFFQVGSAGYVEPKAQMDVWVECWLPAAYMGGKEVIPPQGARRSFGTRFNGGALNCSDLERSDGGPFPFKAAVLKKPDGNKSFWANQILTNDQGMDFQGNPKTHDDPTRDLPPYTMILMHFLR